jgi:uncharacterized protein (TIGR03067 family)
MTPWPIAVLLAVLPAGDDAALKDLQAMQGTWKVAELVEKGRRIPARDTDPIEVEIVGPRLTIRDDGAAREEIKLKLHVDKGVRAVDFHYTKGPSTGNVERGVYSIDGDTLKICTNEVTDGPRPTTFASTRRNGFAYVVLVRVKK